MSNPYNNYHTNIPQLDFMNPYAAPAVANATIAEPRARTACPSKTHPELIHTALTPPKLVRTTLTLPKPIQIDLEHNGATQTHPKLVRPALSHR